MIVIRFIKCCRIYCLWSKDQYFFYFMSYKLHWVLFDFLCYAFSSIKFIYSIKNRISSGFKAFNWDCFGLFLMWILSTKLNQKIYETISTLKIELHSMKFIFLSNFWLIGLRESKSNFYAAQVTSLNIIFVSNFF